MRYRKNNIFSNENGVIMLETLLSLPVYLVILSSVFWLGELCLARQELNGADRLRLYETACRHISGKIAEKDIFSGFDRSTSSRPEVVTGVSKLQFSGIAQSTGESMGWCSQTSGRSTLTVRRSQWSWGITDFLFSRSDDDSKNAMSMISYGTQEQPLDSWIYSRSSSIPEGFNRSGDVSYNNSINWFGIAAGQVYEGSDLKEVSAYERNTDLEKYLPPGD